MAKIKQQFLPLVLSLALAVSTLPVGAFASTAASDADLTFTDIAGNEHETAIQVLADSGIVNGTGNRIYDPDGFVTRSMAVTVLGRLAETEGSICDDFSDVPDNAWYSKYVGWAVDEGILDGIDGNLFYPNQPITGEEMAQMLSNYAEMASVEYTQSNTSEETLSRAEMAEMVYYIYIQDSPTFVETSYGPVYGFVEDNGSHVWLGIPYGQAERWERPQEAAHWSHIMDCTTLGDAAIQYATNWTTGETYLKGSTDCLNLDIYAPSDAEGLPVMVFMHGGNNQTGDSSGMRGQDIVLTNNCVYVSLNFRLGFQGFNPLPALKNGEDPELDSGNYTLLDIALALDWVKENIAAFGGDPNNITISGHSAGGRNVMAMLISPMFEGKFQKAIAFSGGMTVADEQLSAVQVANYIAPLAVEDGKAADVSAATEWLLTDGDDVESYLRSISDERLAELMGNASIHMALFPHLFSDGVVLPEDGFATTEYNSVPVLLLAGKDEFSTFMNFGYLRSDEYNALDDETKTAAKDFAMKYGSDMYRIFNGQESANTMYPNYDAPIYVCEIDYDYMENGEGLAGHGVQQAFMDSKNSRPMVSVDVPGGKEVAEKYNAYLTNFLHTGDPNGDGLAHWEPWDPATQLSMVFDGDRNTATVELKNMSKTYQDINNEILADTTIPQEIKEQIINTVLNGRWFSAALDEYFDTPSLWIAE